MNTQLHPVPDYSAAVSPLNEDDVLRAFDQATVARVTQAVEHGHPELIGEVPDCRRCRRERHGRLWRLRRR